jgi:hypothetical protein
MSNEALQEYLEKMRTRYGEAGKFRKSCILDEVADFCGFTREHTRKVLSGRARIRGRRPGPQPKYGALARKHLRELWMAMEGMCSKRMKEALPLWLKYYSEPDCTSEVRAQLLSMSASTIDRILKPYRLGSLKGKSTTRSNRFFKHRIPLKVLGEIIEKPGFMEADTVAHCGDSIQGEYAHTLTMTDLCSAWTENRITWNKKAADVLKAIEDIEKKLPFELCGFSSDNGNEFLNESLLDYFQHRKGKAPVQFVRGRPYKKNDNPRVEQKNFTHVRQLLGYRRLDLIELVPLINRIYQELWNPLLNFFHPCLRMVSKERVQSKIFKRYDRPKTPYQRLLDSGVLNDSKRRELQAQFQSLNPFVLQFKLKQSMSLLNEIIRRSKEGKIA